MSLNECRFSGVTRLSPQLQLLYVRAGRFTLTLTSSLYSYIPLTCLNVSHSSLFSTVRLILIAFQTRTSPTTLYIGIFLD